MLCSQWFTCLRAIFIIIIIFHVFFFNADLIMKFDCDTIYSYDQDALFVWC